jgi:hypothetical protein
MGGPAIQSMAQMGAVSYSIARRNDVGLLKTQGQ